MDMSLNLSAIMFHPLYNGDSYADFEAFVAQNKMSHAYHTSRKQRDS